MKPRKRRLAASSFPIPRRKSRRRREVFAVGAGARSEAGERIAPTVKAGDRVLFGKWSGTEVKIAGEDLLIMKESDILGVIEPMAELKKAA